MFCVKVTGRSRPTPEIDEHDDIVVVLDKSDLVHHCVDERTARIDARSLLPEFHASPEAQVELPDGTKMSLRDWLVECGVIAQHA